MMVVHHFYVEMYAKKKKKTCKLISKWFLYPVCAGSTPKGLAISISLGCVKRACVFPAVFDFGFAGKFSKVREQGTGTLAN